jgi:diguanylate cyclase (GGDEF)-like protein
MKRARRWGGPDEGAIRMEHNILLVDDDPGLIRVMARMLAGQGQFRFATTGEAALQLARDWQPDLMVLDAELPGMSGFQVCETMKADPVLRDVPIIFVTSHSDHDFEVKGLGLGAVDFIAKPVNEALVLARVKTQLRIKRLTDELRRNATKDRVTKLANQASFEETLSKEWARGLCTGTAISLLLIGLDHMDAYGERYGHQMVDKTLRSVSQALQDTCTHPAEFLARFDRTTFVMLLPGSDRESSEERSHAVLDAIERLGIEHATSPLSGHVTATIGMSVYDRASGCWVEPLATDGVGELPECDAQALFRSAMGALKAARQAGCAQSWWADIGQDDAQGRAEEISAHSRPALLQAAG